MKAQKYVYDLNRVDLWKHIPLRTPYHISIEPTFRCNIRCNYCIHAMDADEIKKRGYLFRDMQWEIFERIVKSIYQFKDKIRSVVFSGLGEPLLHPRIPEMIELIKQTGRVEKVLLITNGLLLTPEMSDSLIRAGLDICKISLQGLSAKSYKQICNVDINWNKFYDNIVYFSQHKGKCVLKVKTGDTSLLKDEEKIFYEKFGTICDYVDIEHIYPRFDGVDYRDVVFEDLGKNRFGHKFKHLNVCSPLFFRLYVLQDGRVTFAYPDGITYEGFNLKEKTLLEIWNSNETKDMWIKALEHNLPICQKCPRWSYSAHPEDIIDGHEKEILEKISIPINANKERQILCMQD